MLLSLMALSLIDVFQLSGSDTLDYFFNVFNGIETTGVTSGAAAGGIFGQAYKLFMYCAFAIIFLGMLYQIFKAFFGPLVQAESPGRVILKSIFFAILVANAQNLVALVFEIATIPFAAIYHDGLSPTWGNTFTFDGAATFGNLASSFPATSIFSMQFWSNIVCVILFFMLIKNFMMLALEMAERYLMLGILTIIAPLCIACGALKGTEEVFKNWLSWIINGCIVLIFTTFFLSIFIANFTAHMEIPYMLLWICWFKVGQKIDEHMNALGLRTAKTGGFGMDVMTALAAGLPTALALNDKVHGTRLNALNNWARKGFSPDAKPKGGFLHMAYDPRAGEKRKGVAGGFQTAISKGVSKATDGKVDLNKSEQLLARKASAAANTVRETIAPGNTTGHGRKTKMSNERLEDYATGKLSMAGLSLKDRDEISKDILDMKAGKALSDTLDNNGLRVHKIGTDRDGNITFSASDGNENKISGQIFENPDPTLNGLVTGEDGETRGLNCATEENPANPMDLSGIEKSFGSEEVPTDKMGVLGADDDNIESSGVIGNEENTSDENTARIAEGSMTEDGKQAEDFNQITTDANEQIAGENVQSATSITDSQGNTFQLGEVDEQGFVTGMTEDGQEATFKANEDGSFTKVGDITAPENIEANNIQKDDSGNMASITDSNGNTYDVSGQEPDAHGMISGVNTATGETANFQVDDNGNVAKMPATESISADNVAKDESGNMTSITDSNGNTFDVSGQQPNSNGMISGVNTATGEMANFQVDNNGNVMKMPTLDNISANNVSTEAVSVKDENGTSFNLSKNEDGTYTGTSSNGSTAKFTQNEDGSLTKTSETREFDQSKGIESVNHSEQIPASNVVTGANNVPAQVKDNNGVTYSNLQANADGTYTGEDSAGRKATFTMGADGSMQMDQVRSYATGTNGEKFEVSQNAMHDTAKDMSGNIQNIDTSKTAVRNANGSVTAMNEDGKTVTLGASYAKTECTDAKTKQSFEMDGVRGFHANVANGTMSVGAFDTKGDLHNVRNASVSVNGKELDVSRGFTESQDKNGNTVYSGYDKNNNKVSFSDSDLRSAQITGGQTTVNTTKSADVMNSRGNTVNTTAFAKTSEEPVMVRSAENGQIFQAMGTQRYDENGIASANGTHMKTMGADNVPRFIPVETNSQNNVLTYQFKNPNAPVDFVKRDGMEYKNYDSNEYNNGISWSHRNTKDNEMATSFNIKNQNYDIPEKDMGKATHKYDEHNNRVDAVMAQHFVSMDGVRYPVDMQQTTFSAQNRVTPNEAGMVSIFKDGQSIEVHANQLDGYPVNKKDGKPVEWNPKTMGGTSCVNDYVRGVDPVNGTERYFNTDKSKVVEQVKDKAYFNGIPTEMNLNKGTVQHILDDDGLTTGTSLYTNGTFQAKCYPEGSNVSGLHGSWVSINGQTQFLQPLECNDMRMQLSQLRDIHNPDKSLDLTKPYDNVLLDKKDPMLTNILNYYGVTDVDSVKNVILNNNMSNAGNGVSISFEQNGRTHVISPYLSKNVKAEKIIQNNSTGQQEHRGYLYSIPNGKSVPKFTRNKNTLEKLGGGARGYIRRNNKKKGK